MSASRFQAHAEVLKLARLLDKPAEDLVFLEDVDPAQLRTLRAQVTNLLFDANLGVLQRMAAASKLLPGPVLAKIAERVFGPLLCARMAGLVETSRGVDVAKRLSPVFLADVATRLDPRRARDIITRIPPDLVRSVARELVRREDWLAIGQFVGSLPDAAMRAGLGEIDDGALLRIAFMLDDKDEVDNVMNLLGPRRLRGLARQAGEQDVWEAAFDLLTHLGETNAGLLATAIGELEPELRAQAAERARAYGIYEQIPLLRQVAEP